MSKDPHSLQDFVQPKDLLRVRRTGYSPGHVRSVLELDTFGPSHSESVEARRLTGDLPPSPNYNRNFSASREKEGMDATSMSHSINNHSLSVRFDDDKSTALNSTGASTHSKGVPSRSRRISEASVGSMASMTSQDSLGRLRMKTPSGRREIMMYEEELHHSTPTSKRLDYANTRVLAQKERREAKLQQKQRIKDSKLKKQEVKEYINEIEKFEQNLCRGPGGTMPGF